MFCPKGPSVLAANGSPGSLTLSGLDRDNLVLRVQNDPVGSVDLTFSGSSGPISNPHVYGTAETFFRVPAEATSISYVVSGSGGLGNTSLALGAQINGA